MVPRLECDGLPPRPEDGGMSGTKRESLAERRTSFGGGPRVTTRARGRKAAVESLAESTVGIVSSHFDSTMEGIEPLADLPSADGRNPEMPRFTDTVISSELNLVRPQAHLTFWSSDFHIRYHLVLHSSHVHNTHHTTSHLILSIQNHSNPFQSWMVYVSSQP